MSPNKTSPHASYFPHNNQHSDSRWSVNKGGIVPYPRVSLAWMTEVRSELLYASPDLRFEKQVRNYLEGRRASFPEGYYVNQLYETVVGKLVHDYLKRNDPETTLSIASSHDDLFAGCDYIISKGDQMVRVDLAVAQNKIRAFEQNYVSQSLDKKVQKFYNSPSIPEEYFAAAKPGISPKSLPLIILRMDRSILSSFIHDFFEILATEKANIDILDYFSDWVNVDANITKERVAYLLGYVNDPVESEFVNDVTSQISILLAGMEGVSTIVQ